MVKEITRMSLLSCVCDCARRIPSRGSNAQQHEKGTFFLVKNNKHSKQVRKKSIIKKAFLPIIQLFIVTTHHTPPNDDASKSKSTNKQTNLFSQ